MGSEMCIRDRHEGYGERDMRLHLRWIWLTFGLLIIPFSCDDVAGIPPVGEVFPEGGCEDDGGGGVGDCEWVLPPAAGGDRTCGGVLV